MKHNPEILTYDDGKGRLAAMTQLSGIEHGSGVSASDSNAEMSAFYDRHVEGLHKYCVYRLYGKDVAEDAVSDVFLRLVEEWPKIRTREEAKLKSWLYGTASNVAAKMLRDSRRQVEILEAYGREQRADLSRSMGSHEDQDRYWAEVHATIAKLPDYDQNLVVMKYLNGFDTGTISELIGVKAVTVRVQLSRAVRKLRKLLGGSYLRWNGAKP